MNPDECQPSDGRLQETHPFERVRFDEARSEENDLSILGAQEGSSGPALEARYAVCCCLFTISELDQSYHSKN